MRNSIVKKLLIVIVFFSIKLVQAGDFSFPVDDIPRVVTMSFPNGFLLANTDEALKRRERFLNFFKLNNGYKGKRSEILILDWKSKEKYPLIIVGVLGSTTENQGKITKSDWLSIRKTFEEVNESKISEIRKDWQRIIGNNSPVEIKITDELLWLEDQKDEN